MAYIYYVIIIIAVLWTYIGYDCFVPTVKIALRLTSDGDGRQNMAKCRSSLGVTGLRPPPGGAHAEQIVTF